MRKIRLESGARRDAEPRARRIRSTTVLCVRRDGKVVMAGDGQVTLGDHVIKHGAKKIRRLYQDKILAGFAGAGKDLNKGREIYSAGKVDVDPRVYIVVLSDEFLRTTI